MRVTGDWNITGCYKFLIPQPFMNKEEKGKYKHFYPKTK